MVKEIKFKIEVDSQKEFEKIKKIMTTHVANLELTGILKIVDLKQEVELVEEK